MASKVKIDHKDINAVKGIKQSVPVIGCPLLILRHLREKKEAE